MKKYKERLEECKKQSNDISLLCRDVVRRLKGINSYTEKSEVGILTAYYDRMDRLNSEIYELKLDMVPNVGSIVQIKKNYKLGVVAEVSLLDETEDYKSNQYLDIKYRVIFFNDSTCKEYTVEWFNDIDFDTIMFDTLSLDHMVIVSKLNKLK